MGVLLTFIVVAFKVMKYCHDDPALNSYGTYKYVNTVWYMYVGSMELHCYIIY